MKWESEIYEVPSIEKRLVIELGERRGGGPFVIRTRTSLAAVSRGNRQSKYNGNKFFTCRFPSITL